MLQVYSYCNSHFPRDRWPLKSFVRHHVLCSMLRILKFLTEPFTRSLSWCTHLWKFYYPNPMQCTIVTPSSTRLVDSLHMALVSHTTYWVAVTNFGDYSAFQVLPWYVAPKSTVICIWGSLWRFQESSRASVLWWTAVLILMKQISLKLSALSATACEFVCWDRLLFALLKHTQWVVLGVSVQQYVVTGRSWSSSYWKT